VYVLGVNLTTTGDGVPLFDGAAALLHEGRPVAAIAEERLTRRKHCGGVVNAVAYCLDAAGITLDDVETVAVSICCDVPPTPEAAAASLRVDGVRVRDEQVVVCPSHHLSHAASAFLASCFDEAVTVVADNEGVILGRRVHKDYWLNALERTTVWRCASRPSPSLAPIASYHDGPGELGLGAAYNYFTKWLGFNSYHDAGQTMALAAFAAGKYENLRLFEWSGTRLVCALQQQHQAKATAVSDWLDHVLGASTAQPRQPGATVEEIHFEIAAIAQQSIEEALLDIIGRAVDETGIRNVCLAGGVALNCVANERIARTLDLTGLFVQPAASDVGQALGNALWAYHQAGGQPRHWAMDRASLGRTYTTADIEAAVRRNEARVGATRLATPAVDVARRIAEGQIVGWFVGGSEYGLRSLGWRSILADPRRADSKHRLDTDIKKREWFRPYAPSVVAEAAHAWFDLGGQPVRAGDPVTFMLQAVPVRPERQSLIPAVVHVDGSARVHVVEPETNRPFHEVIEEFGRLTGVPVVLNTSFNAAGNPIVETPEDAINEFLAMNLDCLVLEDHVVTRT
jgi:carbamoyltransferase